MTHTPPHTQPLFHTVVTRHPGAAEWVQTQLEQNVDIIAHLALNQVRPNGCYYGVFPLNLAAAICAAGSECWAIAVDMPPELRGQELTAQQLNQLKAELVRYQVAIQATQPHTPPAHAKD